MVYFLNHKQQKELKIIMKSSAQVAEAMPAGEERDAILKATYRNSYLPLMKASKRCGLFWYTKINLVLRFYCKPLEEQKAYPFVLYDNKNVTIYCSANSIGFTCASPMCERYWYNIKDKTITYEEGVTEKNVCRNAKLLMEMVGKLGTNESYTSLTPSQKRVTNKVYNVMEGNYNVIFGILSEKGFVHLADVINGYSQKYYWSYGDSAKFKEVLR